MKHFMWVGRYVRHKHQKTPRQVVGTAEAKMAHKDKPFSLVDVLLLDDGTWCSPYVVAETTPMRLIKDADCPRCGFPETYTEDDGTQGCNDCGWRRKP